MSKYRQIITGFICLLSILTTQAQEIPSTVVPEINYELGGGAGHYNYSPSFITDRYGIIYGYMCQNRNPFEIVDYIYLYKGIPTRNGIKWQPGTEVLEPSRTGWDDCHICDPDVREFTTRYRGHDYKWIMTYLGVDRWDCNHNQVGIALSDNIEGPWVKYDRPIIPYEKLDKWGTGQSKTLVLNDSTLAIFYHTTTADGKSWAMRLVDLTDLDRIDTGDEHLIPFFPPNTFVALSDDMIYTVTSGRSDGYERVVPTWVGDMCIARCKPRSGLTPADLLADMTAPADTWIEIGRVTPSLSGFPRNFCPGLLTDTRGYIPNVDRLVVYFSTAVTGEDWLWSYDMYSATFDLSEFNKALNKQLKK